MLLNSLFKQWSYRIVAPGVLLREKYEALKVLLRHDSQCHEQMATFQDLVHSEQPEDFCRIRQRFALFSDQVAKMIDALEILAPGKYTALKAYHKKFDFYTRFLLAPPKIDHDPPFVLKLIEIPSKSNNIGNKAKHLSILKRDADIPVPRSFAITTSAFHSLIKKNNLRKSIDEILAEIDINDGRLLSQKSKELQKLIRKAKIPKAIMAPIFAEYDNWQAYGQEKTVVAVRSSALGEDGENSFAGQYASILNVNRKKIADAYLKVIASKYSPEALFYRINKGLNDEETAMSVLIQEMVAAKNSGVLYTSGIDPEDGFQDCIHLHVIAGIGERLVGGEETPDYYVLKKKIPTSVLKKEIHNTGPVDTHIQKLTELSIRIEKVFGVAQDIEWAADHDDKIYILQARSLYRTADHKPQKKKKLQLNEDDVVLDGCTRASGGIGCGLVYLVDENNSFEDVPSGAVLITRNTPANYVTVISKLKGVLAEHGSRASHFATVAREFNIPLLTGIDNVLNQFEKGSIITVDGNTGTVYKGRVNALLTESPAEFPKAQERYRRTLEEALKFITPLELIDPAEKNFTPEGCRSLHDIVRFSHEKALQSLFSSGRPGTGLGAVKLAADIPLDVYLFDVGGGMSKKAQNEKTVSLPEIASIPFHALWRGLSHQDVQWKQKPFDWDAFDRIELTGAVAPRKDSFAFASYAVIGGDYLHFNIRFGYHFTIVDVICGQNAAENHCMLRFAGGGGDFDHRSLRLDFLVNVLERLEFEIDIQGDLLEAKILGQHESFITDKLDILGRLLGASKLMDMVLEDQQMVEQCVDEFFDGRYSFSEEG